MNSRSLDGTMELYFDKTDVVNDVIRLKTKHEQFNSQRDVFRKLVVEKDIDSDYKRMMQLVLANTNNRREHPKRKRDNVSIIDIDPQYGLFLGRLKEHAKSYAVEGENENGLPVYVKYDGTSASEGESGHIESSDHSVEQLERIFNRPSQNWEVGVDQDSIMNRATQIRDASASEGESGHVEWTKLSVEQLERIFNPPSRTREVGVDQDWIMNRAMQIRHVGVDQDQIFNLPTKNLNVGVDQDRRINRLTQNLNVGIDRVRVFSHPNVAVDQDRAISTLAQYRNVGVDRGRIMNRGAQNYNVGVDQDQIFNLPTQNLNVGVDQDRRTNCLTQNLSVCIDQDRVFSHPNVAVDQDRAISTLAQYRNVGVDRGRIMNRGTQNYNVGVDRGRIIKRATQNVNVGVDKDRRINCLTQNLNVVIYQDRAIRPPAQHRNVGVDRDRVISRQSQNCNSGVHQVRKIIRPTQNHNVGVHQDRPVTENKSRRHRKVKWKDMVDGDDEDTNTTVWVNNKNIGRKNGPGNNQAKGNHRECVNHGRPSKNKKVQGQTRNLNSGVDQDRKIIRPTQNWNVGVHQVQPVTKNKSLRHRVKWKDMDNGDTKPTVWANNENLGRKSASVNNQAKGKNVNPCRPIKNEKVQGDNGFLCQKTNLRDCVAKDRLVCKVKTQSIRKRAHCDADVEILENDAFRQHLGSFEPSKIYHKISEDDDVDGHNVGSMSSAADVFRKKLMDVLIKPFDKDELKRLRDHIRDGSYYHYHPDLEKKMKKHRYKRGKCLNILRGFFFWLQKVSQEGAFRPWKDGRCLAVEPGPPENSTPSHSNRAKQLKRKII